jgi:hypothetical protein
LNEVRLAPYDAPTHLVPTQAITEVISETRENK